MKRTVLIVAVCLLALSGCAPGLDTSLSVSDIPTSDSAPRTLSGVRMKVEAFQDLRSTDRIATINGRDVRPEGDVGVSVQQGIERQFKVQGGRLALFNAPTIRGTVQEWNVRVKPGFPSSTASAVAKISIDLLDSKGKKISTGAYRGVMEAENPMLSESKVTEILGSAMQQAIQHMLADQKFLSKLRDASAGSAPDDIIEGDEESGGPSRVPIEQPSPEEEIAPREVIEEGPTRPLSPPMEEEPERPVPQLRNSAPYQAEPNERY